MGVYGESLANRRLILLAVLSLVASLLAVGFSAPAASAASGDATVTLTATSTSTANESGTVDITAEITAIDTVATIPAELTIDLVRTGGVATNPADYTRVDSAFVWAAGSGVGAQDTITITIVPDTIDEGASELVSFALQNAPVGTTLIDSTYDLTITDDDGTPSLSVGNVTVDEGDGSLTFTVTASGTSSSEITFDYTTANGTATAPADYLALSGTNGSIPAGSTTDTFEVTINEDAIDEGASEAFSFVISNPSNATLGDATGVGTITDNDDPPTLTIGDESLEEQNGNMVFTVTRSGSDTTGNITFDYTLTDDTASSPDDYDSTGGSGTIAPGAPGTTTISVPINEDAIHEDDETFTVALNVTSGNATNPAGPATGTITDDDPASVAFTNASSNVQEDGGSHTITVTLDVPGGGTLVAPVTVDIDDDLTGTASGSDYDLDTASVTFGAGSPDGATRNVGFTINDDAIEEPNETIDVSLTVNLPGINGSQETHTVTIIDDESRNFVITPTGLSTVVGEPSGTDTFAVKLTQAPTGTVTVNLTKDAEPGEFSVTPTVLTFTTSNWNTNKTVTVTAVDDDLVDGDRAGDVMLTGAGGGYSGVTGNESVTIRDDDEAGATVVQTAGNTSVSEGGSADTYTIVLDAMPTANVTVNLVYNVEQINVSPSSFTFTPGGWDTPKVFSVTAIADGKEEPASMTETIQHSTQSADTIFDDLPVDPVTVTITDVDELQVTIEGPEFGSPGYTSTFTAVQNAAGTGTVEYAWLLVGPAGNVLDEGENPNFSFTPTAGGRHIVRATVNDDNTEISFFQFFTVLGDTGGNVFVEDIIWLAEEGITKGCNPPTNDQFCPSDTVTRGQMAAFLVRFLSLTDIDPTISFNDTAGNIFEQDILKLATAGITRGCNVDGTSFCPLDGVTRGQMAAFLVRAFSLTDDGGGDLFTDDDTSIFEGDIDRLATAGITRGCNPPTNDRFCPTSTVTRGQMAAFLHRAEGLLP